MQMSKFSVAMLSLQVLTVGCLLTMQSPTILPAAHGQVMDSGGQRQQMVEELKAINTKMDRLLTVLEGGKLQVQANTPDEQKDGRSKR